MASYQYPVLGQFLFKKRGEQGAKLKDAFAAFDQHNTGFINCDDVGNVLRSIGENPTDDQVKHAIDVLDVDKNGVVGFTNFLNFLPPTVKDDDLEEDLNTAFKMVDKDEDGYITAAEVRDASIARCGPDLTDEQANSIVEGADLDGDGKLSYEEFKKFMLRI